MSLRLADALGLRGTTDFAVSLRTPEESRALVTDSCSFAFGEARTLIDILAARGAPPRAYQGLLREGGSIWRLGAAGGEELCVARLFRHPDLDPEPAELGLAALTGRRGAPVLFVCLATGEAGHRQEAALRAAGNGAFAIRRHQVEDWRWVYPRSQDPNLRLLGQGLAHPVLAEAIPEMLLGG